MKKTILLSLGILAILMILSFTYLPQKNDVAIRITSEEVVEFDMVKNGRTTMGLETPYTFKYDDDEATFIFRANDKDAQLMLSAENTQGSTVMMSNIIVLNIECDELTTYSVR